MKFGPVPDVKHKVIVVCNHNLRTLTKLHHSSCCVLWLYLCVWYLVRFTILILVPYSLAANKHVSQQQTWLSLNGYKGLWKTKGQDQSSPLSIANTSPFPISWFLRECPQIMIKSLSNTPLAKNECGDYGGYSLPIFRDLVSLAS